MNNNMENSMDEFMDEKFDLESTSLQAIKNTQNQIFNTEDEILSALNFELLTEYPISFLKKFCYLRYNRLIHCFF